ncbi:hypothetical protein BZK31_13070 [Pseudomonas floridensis]|uniref:CTP synthase (glutamine hydrolyzing) n=1 Tax=Pseudomonas floridensis TaxID=1958950 RepID=A0A1X0N5P3_9PSED|nr:CTP synthase [Pseudomonas floridensis]ORC58895.1 hypothetical protein BZK31_13070 [Pseudomonas floridensis]
MDVVTGTGEDVRIGLVGDFDVQVTAHRAIALALQTVGDALQIRVSAEWLPTTETLDTDRLSAFDGLWCVPGSPYRNMQGALRAIRFARERRMPFLGTCGGFQHALLEFARNVLGWSDAEHGESAPDSPHVIIAPLSCSLVDAQSSIRLVPDTLIARAYDRLDIEERYHCRYGLRRELEPALFSEGLTVTGRDPGGEVRSMELHGHPFFVATLFQPERAVLQGVMPPLVKALVQACRSGEAQ